MCTYSLKTGEREDLEMSNRKSESFKTELDIARWRVIFAACDFRDVCRFVAHKHELLSLCKAVDCYRKAVTRHEKSRK